MKNYKVNVNGTEYKVSIVLIDESEVTAAPAAVAPSAAPAAAPAAPAAPAAASTASDFAMLEDDDDQLPF